MLPLILTRRKMEFTNRKEREMKNLNAFHLLTRKFWFLLGRLLLFLSRGNNILNWNHSICSQGMNYIFKCNPKSCKIFNRMDRNVGPTGIFSSFFLLGWDLQAQAYFPVRILCYSSGLSGEMCWFSQRFIRCFSLHTGLSENCVCKSSIWLCCGEHQIE